MKSTNEETQTNRFSWKNNSFYISQSGNNIVDFKSCFEQIQSLLPFALVDEKSKANVLHSIPEFKSFSVASIECGLSSTTGSVDIALGFEKDLLSDHICQWIPDEQILFKAILNRNHFMNECVRGIWLNFDVSAGTTSEPWAYIVLHKMNLGHEFNAALLSQFFQPLLTENQERSLPDKILKALPDHAYILGLSPGHIRNQGATRLVLYGMHADQIITYLQSIPWKGDVDLVRKMFTKFKFNVGEIGLIINIADDEINDSVGFELLLVDQSADKIKYIVNELLNEQLIHPAKHLALIEWCTKNNTSDSNHEIRFWINHIKLTFSTPNSWSAKCYFGIQPGYPSFG